MAKHSLDFFTGNGGNILIGGAGTNVLTDAYTGSAASGRSILIGGTGSSTLTAGAAGDILIAAHTHSTVAACYQAWEGGFTERYVGNRANQPRSGQAHRSVKCNRSVRKERSETSSTASA
jgi:hypothetical protein